MAKSKFPAEIRKIVENRASGRCEYCMASVVFAPHPFTMDHIIPSISGGTDDLDNLAMHVMDATAVNMIKQPLLTLFHKQKVRFLILEHKHGTIIFHGI